MHHKLQPINKHPITLKGVPKGISYHYTSLDSFRKIIESKCFHLTHYKNLKDNRELVWAEEVYLNSIKPLFPSFVDFSKVVPQDYYLFCTCIRDNNKHLWKEYGAEFSGVAIGINISKLYQTFFVKVKEEVGHPAIHMTPMDYNTAAYEQLCKESVEGLTPIALRAPVGANMAIEEKDYETQKKFLESIPGYAEYMKRRDAPLGAMTLQKNVEYSPEEEFRIVHWPYMVNAPLQIVTINEQKKAILPWAFNKLHFIEEVITTRKNIPLVQSVLDQGNIQTNIRKIKPNRCY